MHELYVVAIVSKTNFNDIAMIKLRFITISVLEGITFLLRLLLIVGETYLEKGTILQEQKWQYYIRFHIQKLSDSKFTLYDFCFFNIIIS